jgi:hypothetical protein
MPDTPLRPDELETYKTDVQTASEASDDAGPTPAGDARPWMALGLVLLVIFILALLVAVSFLFAR